MPSPLVLAAPYAPPNFGKFRTLGMSWQGWDGSSWDLTDWRGGIALMRDGVTGLHNPRITKYKSESRAVPGHRRRGWRTAERDVFWPLYVYGDGSEAWRQNYDRFFNTIHPDREGIWTVTAGPVTRRLRLTGVFDDNFQFGADPYQRGWVIIPVQLEPSQPYWEGKTAKAGPYSAPVPVDFIGPGGAPTFHISQSDTFVEARITNAGDVEAWLVWTVRGPLTGVQLGAGGVSGEVPFDVPDGQVLYIDTDPRRVTARLDGADVTAELGLIEFGPVQPGANVDLTINATGAGSITAELVPLHMRAF